MSGPTLPGCVQVRSWPASRAVARCRTTVRRGNVDRRPSGSRTSTSSPHDRIHRRISMVPGDGRPPGQRAVVGDVHALASGATSPPGPAPRPTARSAARPRSRGWSAMMSHARRSALSRPSPSGSSNVRGVSATSRIRSILKVRSAVPGLVPADQVQGVGLERRLDEVRPDDRPAGGRLGRVARRLVLERHDPPLRPGPRQRWTCSLKAASRGCWARTSSVRSTCSASGRGRTSSSFSNAAARSGSYLSA